MSITIAELLKGRGKPLCAESGWTAEQAQEQMAEYDYSQLPVVDSDGKLVGLVTAEHILYSIPRFNLPTKGFRVKDCMDPKPPAKPEDENLADVVSDLENFGAIIALDARGCVVGIVTDYDVAAFYRRKAESAILIEDIESLVRELILLPYGGSPPNRDKDFEAGVASASRPEWQKEKFSRAISTYLKEAGEDPKLEPSACESAFAVLIGADRKPKKFEDLDFGELVAMWLSDASWPAYSGIVGLERAAVRNMLDRTREIRNVIAHFKREVTHAELGEIGATAEWMEQHAQVLAQNFGTQSAPSEQTVSVTAEVAPAKITGLRSILERNQKYAPLARALANSDQATVALSFDGVESLVGALPGSARAHRAWWANSAGSPQADAWLGVGYVVKHVSLERRVVQFSKMPVFKAE